MIESDKKEFKEILDATFIASGRKALPTTAVMVWWNVFIDFEMEDVRTAFSRAIAESTEFLVPGLVRRYLPDKSGFLSPEEAWNRLPKSESEPAWVYPELMEAAGAAWDSLERGNLIGARMAFIESYKVILDRSRASRKKAKWFYSEASGLPYESRMEIKAQHTLEAMEKQWITQERATVMLESISKETGIPANIQEKLTPIRKMLLIENGSDETPDE